MNKSYKAISIGQEYSQIDLKTGKFKVLINRFVVKLLRETQKTISQKSKTFLEFAPEIPKKFQKNSLCSINLFDQRVEF